MKSITSFLKTLRPGFVAAATLVGTLAFAGRAEAGSITFNFNCVITSATNCNAAGPFGTLKLTDSLTDTNRVDVDIILNAANIQALNDQANGLNDFFLNYSGLTPANSSFKLVRQSDPAGTFGSTAGDGAISLNTKGPLGTTLDIDFDPAGSVPSWTYSGSIVLRMDSGQHAEIDLNVDMFYLKDANDLLYAGFDSMSTNHKFFGGSTEAAYEITATSVPEPTSLVLLGSGLLAAVHVARRRTARR